MKFLSFRFMASFVLFLISGGALLQIAQHVQELEARKAAMERAISREIEAIAVLEAEWAYLNSPPRLEALAGDYLGLKKPEARVLHGKPGTIEGAVPARPDGSHVFVKPQPVAYEGENL